MKRRFVESLGLAAIWLATVFSSPLYADSPALEELKTHIASLQQVLADTKLAGDAHLFQRRKLAQIVEQQLFDFREMSRRSLGANALRYQDRLGEFTPLFIDFLKHAYIGTLEEDGDAKIRYVREVNKSESAEIDTRTRLKDGREYEVDYLLYMSPAGWRAYDVVVERISLVDNYRAQFDRFLRRKSFDELLQYLRDKKAKFD